MPNNKRILGDLRIFQAVSNDLNMKHEFVELADGSHEWVYTYEGVDPYELEDDSFPLTTELIRQQTARAELEGQQNLINIIPLFGDELSQFEWFADKIGEIQGQLKDLDKPKGSDNGNSNN